jgi:hypothetical protein
MYCGNKVIEQIPEKMVLFRISRDITPVLTLMTGLRLWCLMPLTTIFQLYLTVWWSVLLVEETGVASENHQPVANH